MTGMMRRGVMGARQVLCLHLKRFRWGRYSRSKVKDIVSFPMRNLDLTPYMDPKSPKARLPPVYDLYAVVIHHGQGCVRRAEFGGTAERERLIRRARRHRRAPAPPHRLGSGHYTALAHNDTLDQWVDFNDGTVQAVAEDDVRSAQAYLLFYRHRDCT